MAKKELATQHTSDADIPIEIIGYVTDPKLVGYQILTNYESTYWRSLVGRDAWALYETLRSFCHEGNDTCNPSIKLLMEILGITDRRQLTGRVTVTRGKERVLPGLIDDLQEYKLAVAEMKGEGPLLRYTFHVNLTPPPLTKEQLEQLPKRLQRKHAQLLKRVARDVQKLDKIERKKPKKGRRKDFDRTEQDPSEESGDFSGSEKIISEGGGTAPVPPGTAPVPPGTEPPPPGTVPSSPGTVPPKQHPHNNTHITTTVVVEKLKGYDIESEKAQDLVMSYSSERINEKIEFLEWKLALQESGRQRRGRPISDHAGWLIRAIEEDYQPPKAFFDQKEQVEEVEQLTWEGEGQEQIAELDQRPSNDKLAQLMEEYETSQRETDLWKATLGELALQVPRSTFDTRFASTHLLSLNDNGQAVIGAPNQFAFDWLKHRLAGKISRTLEGLTDNETVELEFVVLRGNEGDQNEKNAN